MSSIAILHPSPIGALTLVCDGAGLSGLYFENHKVGGPPKDAAPGADRVLDEARRQLDAYFAGRLVRFDVPLSTAGTAFQARVWAALRAIAPGVMRTYGAIAEEIGAPAAVRAVGAAIGRNPISIIVPCHRVVGANGALTGFAGGLERKAFLLALERAAAPQPSA